MKNPCEKTCPRRSPTCHGECPEYAAWAVQKAAERQARREAQAIEAAVRKSLRRKWRMDQKRIKGQD